MKKESSFGAWLYKQRRSLDLSRKAFADQVGCAQVTLRRIENDTLKPSKELALILLEKLGIPENDHLQWVQFARGLTGYPEQPVSSSVTKPLTNLPSLLTTFIGRQKEQVEIINHLNKYRLVSLTGSGGVGKTRLSIKVGEQVLGNYPDGIWLVELASLSDPALLPQTLIKVFGITTQSDTPLIEILITFLHAKTILLILDNCEHLLDACAQLTDTLLKNCPHLKVLTTSREPLGITGEAIYHVPSLGIPHVEQMLERLREYDSMHLFEERAQLVQTDFSLTLENAAFVAQICSRLDGIPLALELAAAKVSSLSTKEIAEQLEMSFNLLTGGSRTALPRQQTIRASIEWSWGLLTESEQKFMQQLSVFSGGWTLESAQAVCDGDILELTNFLVMKSLIMVDRGSGYEPRYHFHETICQYAREKLNTSGKWNIYCLRHLTFFAEMGVKAERNFYGPDQALWYSRLDNELDNLRTALTWFDGIENAEMKLRFAAGLWRYWKNRGLISEGRKHLQRILEGLPLGISRETSACARALTAAGSLAYYEGDIPYSEQSRKEALTIFRNLGDRIGIADCLIGLGNTAISQGNYDTSRQFYEESLMIRKELGDKWGVARLLGNLGLLTYFQTDYIQSQSLHSESLTLFRELQDDEGVVNELVNLGDVYYCQKDFSTANALYKESAVIARNSKDQWGLAYAIKGMADVVFEQGDISTATTLYRECLTVFLKSADNVGLSFALESVAVLARAENQPEKAVRIFGAADALRQATKSPLPPPNRSGYQMNLSILQHHLDSSTFNIAWAEGRAMTVHEAVAFALE